MYGKKHKKIKWEKVALKKAAFFAWSCLFFLTFTIISPIAVFSSKAEEIKWKKIASFTTWYSQKDGGRCENIALAASFIDGVVVQPYGEFSFNQTVGERTAKRGFKQAKIIMNGEYVQGVGGGVCQVSTTLYNAALLSGFCVTEFHPHSLAVAYVDPSRDAMVSSTSDLKFFNPLEVPVKIRLQVREGGIFASFFAKGEIAPDTSYKIVVCVLQETPPPETLVRQGEEDSVLQTARNGVESESYLEAYCKGVLLSRQRLRKDVYAPVREILVKKIEDPTKKLP